MKRKVALVCALLFALVGVVFYYLHIQSKTEQEVQAGVAELTEAAPMLWLKSFVARDFATCDSLVYSQDSRLYNPLVITRSRDDRYYEKLLSGVVNCVSDVRVIDHKNNEYKVLVRLTKYEAVQTPDLSRVSGLLNDYLAEALVDMEFNQELRDLYYKAYIDMCFQLGETEVELVTILSESEVEGRKFVDGTVEFVDLILTESGLLDNITEYETSIQSTVDGLLKLG